MTTKRLTDEEVTSYIKQANDYIKLSMPYTEVLPIKPIQECYVHKWYVNTEVEVPESSKDGRMGKDVRSARVEGSANVMSYTHTFEIPRVEIDMARQGGIDLWADNVGAAMRKMNDSILHLILENSFTWDKIAISGMRAGGTDLGAGADAMAWDTITNPINHLALAWSEMNDAGFTGPYQWILSSNLGNGMKKKYGAGDPIHEKMVGDYDVESIKYLPIGTSTKMDVYPFDPADADDGVWILYKKDPMYAYLAEVMPPTVTIEPELDNILQCYHGRIEWRGTVAIVQPTSILYNNGVNLE
jgi:hypothetical protein